MSIGVANLPSIITLQLDVLLHGFGCLAAGAVMFLHFCKVGVSEKKYISFYLKVYFIMNNIMILKYERTMSCLEQLR